MQPIAFGTSYLPLRHLEATSQPAVAWLRVVCAQFHTFLTSRWTLLTLKLAIGLVSACDIYLTIKYVQSLPELELNPIGRLIMGLDSGPNCELDQIAGFITAKFLGNVIALSTIELLCSWKRSAASLVAFTVAAFQLVLLWFLLFGGSEPM